MFYCLTLFTLHNNIRKKLFMHRDVSFSNKSLSVFP